MNIIGRIGDALGSIFNGVDELVTSDEERLKLKAVIFPMQAEILTLAVDMEKMRLQAATEIIKAEAQSDSWLTSNWRPLTALSFVAMMVLSWIGVGPPVPDWMPLTINIMLGGYVGSRSLEKIAGLTQSLKGPEEV